MMIKTINQPIAELLKNNQLEKYCLIDEENLLHLFIVCMYIFSYHKNMTVSKSRQAIAIERE